MRQTPDDHHGARLLIVVLWRRGRRVQEALATHWASVTSTRDAGVRPSLASLLLRYAAPSS